MTTDSSTARVSRMANRSYFYMNLYLLIMFDWFKKKKDVEAHKKAQQQNVQEAKTAFPKCGVTPNYIEGLKENEIFVFGSNLRGSHGAGAAYTAFRKFGAILGQGVGLQGQSYAIPTMQGGIDTIKPYTDEFIAFAKEHIELHFLVTKIGCGIAGFREEDIAHLFADAVGLSNVSLPQEFIDIIRS